MTVSRRERGFALLLVLWIVVFLSAVAVHFSAAGRTQIALARNVVDAARAEALADGAVVAALFNLAGPQPDWAADGSTHRQSFEAGEAAIAVEDENAKINPNLASPRLLGALFEALGAGKDAAEIAATALTQRRAEMAEALLPGTPRPGIVPDGANVPVEQGREIAAFVFESLDDLDGIDGLPARLLAAARPYLSVYAELPQPVSPFAAAPVRLAVARSAGPNAAPPAARPAATVPVAEGIYRITASAATRSGARFVRETVAKVDPTRSSGYAIMLWRRLPAGP